MRVVISIGISMENNIEKMVLPLNTPMVASIGISMAKFIE
jgi:hypothetical protein